MPTIYLRTPDRDALLTALTEASLTTTDEDGNTVPVCYSHSHAMSIRGEIRKIVSPGEYDDEGNEITAPEIKVYEGCHVDWSDRFPLPAELEPFRIEPPPKTPQGGYA